MANLFSIFVESDSPAAFRAYGTLASATARQEALLNAGRVFLDKGKLKSSHLPSLEEIAKHYTRASGLRNNVAHGIVVPAKGYDIGLSGFFLISPFYNSRKYSVDRKRFAGRIAKRSIGKWTMDDIAYGLAFRGMISGSSYRYNSEIVRDISSKVAWFPYVIVEFIASLPGRSIFPPNNDDPRSPKRSPQRASPPKAPRRSDPQLPD